MLRITDRYIIREILRPSAVVLLVFTFLLMMQPIMEVAERLMAKGVDAATVARLMVNLLPSGLGVTIPMALLMGLLIGLGRLSADRETVALQACGVSIFQMLTPVALVAIVAAALTHYILVVALPDANQRFREITYEVVATRAQDEVRPRVFYEDFPNIVVYVQDVAADGSWSQVFLADTRHGGQPDVYLARKGRMQLDREKRLVDMVLEDGTGHHINGEGPDQYELTRFEEIRISLDPESVFPVGGPQRGYREFTIPELQAEAARLEAAGLPSYRSIIELHRKFSIPVACLVFGVIGLALGVTSRKDGKLASFVLGISVIFAYYVVMFQAEAMAKAALISPHLAMWLPNIGLGLAGVVLLCWRSRSAERRITIPLPRRRAGQGSEVSSRAQGSGGLEGSGSGATVGAVPRVWGLGLTILDGYVVKLYLSWLSLAFLGLLGIFYISTFIDLSDKLFRGETDGRTLLAYFWYTTPQFIYYLIPVSALVATLVTIGLLTKSSELTVMKACGISLYRVAAPLLLFGALGGGFLFVLEETVLANANRRAEEIRHVMRGGSPQTFDVINRQWIVGKTGSIYHYLYLDPRRDQLNGLSVYEFDGWQLSKRTFAAEAVFREGWEGHDVWVREFTASSTATPFKTFTEQDLPLESPEYFETQRPAADRMSYGQLRTYIGELRASGFDVVQPVAALHRKLSFPLVAIIMTLIALPFAVTTGCRGAMYGVGIGIAVAAVYWIVISIFAAIGDAGLLAPVLAAWAPNVLFGASAVYLLLTVRT